MKETLKKSKLLGIILVVIALFVLFISIWQKAQTAKNKTLEAQDIRQKAQTVEDEALKAKEAVISMQFDIIRIKNAANIMLALQDYYFKTGDFPKTLGTLVEKKYLDTGIDNSITDPKSGAPYYYLKRDNNFVLCVPLDSEGVRGFNISECSKTDVSEATSTSAIKQDKTATPIKNKTAKLEVVGNVSFVNVRAESNTSSDIIAKVNPGDIFTFEDTKDNWYKISVTAEKIGWINKNYVKVLQSP